MHGRMLWMAVLLAALCLRSGAPEAFAFEAQKTGFSVKFKGEVNPHAVLGVFLLPGEVLPLEVVKKDEGQGRYELLAGTGRIVPKGVAAWEWTAPVEKGHYPLRIVQQPSGETMTFNVFVMIPTAPNAQEVNGYKLGTYPEKPLKGLALYLPPKGFVEVTAANRGVEISPHFTLGQFVCKQGTGYPKYVTLRERMLLKLEAVLEGVNEAGYRADTFHVMSGYRTPAYNQAIKNGQYSRHIYGDAADIFIDQDRDGVMDDLNRNGRSDLGDAIVLRDLIEDLSKKSVFRDFVGGLGLYNSTKAHGPYVHVDTRGFLARWTV